MTSGLARRTASRSRSLSALGTATLVVMVAGFALLGALAAAAGARPTGGPIPRAPHEPGTATALAPHLPSRGTESPEPLPGGGPSGSGPVRLGGFTIPGPHLASWGPSGIPPGAEALDGLGHAPGASATWGPSWANRFCAGLWPGGSETTNSQSYYAPGCTGAD